MPIWPPPEPRDLHARGCEAPTATVAELATASSAKAVTSIVRALIQSPGSDIAAALIALERLEAAAISARLVLARLARKKGLNV